MEVIGAGWGRTGTMTLKTALDKLGLPCYHMVEVVRKKEDAEQWLMAAEGKPVDLAKLLEGYKACCDWPTTSYYEQLMEMYPNAKVILTVRDPAKWYQSAKDTIWRLHAAMEAAPWYVYMFAPWIPPGPAMRRMVKLDIWEGDLQGCFGTDPQRAQQLFHEHNERVKQIVPADKLLVFEPSQGWGPLCEFLGKPVPDEPFPHANDTKAFQAMIVSAENKLAVMTYAIPAAAAAVVAGAGFLLMRGLNRK